MTGWLRALPCLLVLLGAAPGAWAQSYGTALEQAGDGLAASLGRRDLPADSLVGVARFQGAAGVACEPLSTILTGGLRRTLVRHVERMGVKVNVSERVEPQLATAVVSGQWFRDSEDRTRLVLKLGDVSDMRFRNLALEEITFDTESLPPEARRCVLELEPIEREILADRRLIAREAPSSVGRRIEEIAPGSQVWVAGRVLSEGGEDWFVVRLPDDEAMPVGMRQRHAFVFGLTPPDDLRRRVRVIDMDASFVLQRTANLRAEPSARSEKLDTLPAGNVVQVIGKVVDRDWYQISWQDDHAYVYAPLLAEVDAAEAADWTKVREGGDREALEAFLRDWPNGTFAKPAKERLAALAPTLEVRAWTDRETYRKGEEITVFLEGNKDFYARVVYRDASGTLIQLLPNRYRETNRFAGGRTYRVPDDTDRFVLEVSPPFGTESILVFSSTAPLGEVEGEDIGGGLSLLEGNVDEVRVRTRGVKVRERDAGDVKREDHESSVELTTRP